MKRFFKERKQLSDESRSCRSTPSSNSSLTMSDANQRATRPTASNQQISIEMSSMGENGVTESNNQFVNGIHVPNPILKDSFDMSVMSEDTLFEQHCRYTVNGIHEPNLILKDNDLKHKIRMPYDTAIEVFQQLQMDADFLHRIGVMDYSLLVGVHNTEYGVSPSQASAAAAGGSSQSVAVPVSPAASMPQETPQIVSSRRHDVYRVVGPCAYYMGIIDFQQKWNFSKKMERFLKLNLHGADPEGLSAIAPDTYKERFIRKIEDILDFDDESKPSCAFLRIPSSHQLGQKTEVE